MAAPGFRVGIGAVLKQQPYQLDVGRWIRYRVHQRRKAGSVEPFTALASRRAVRYARTRERSRFLTRRCNPSRSRGVMTRRTASREPLRLHAGTRQAEVEERAD